MKKILAILALSTLALGCTKQAEIEPAPPASTSVAAAAKSVLPIVTYPPLSFCYSETQTSSDSWNFTVNKNGGNPYLYQGTFEIEYDFVSYSGVTHYGWLSLGGSLPQFGRGNLGSATHIRIRQNTGMVGTDRSGNPMFIYTYYDVNYCG